MVVPVAATGVDIGVGVVAMLPTKRRGLAMQLYSNNITSACPISAGTRGRRGIGWAQERIWISPTTSHPNVPAALGFPVPLALSLCLSLSLLQVFKWDKNWLVLSATGYIWAGVCVALELWVEWMYNNRRAHQARPSYDDRVAWGNLGNDGDIILLFCICLSFLHPIIDN